MSVRKLLELIADDRNNDLQPLNISINGLMIQKKDISGIISFSKKVQDRRDYIKRKSWYRTHMHDAATM